MTHRRQRRRAYSRRLHDVADRAPRPAAQPDLAGGSLGASAASRDVVERPSEAPDKAASAIDAGGPLTSPEVALAGVDPASVVVIRLTHGMTALIDAADLPLVATMGLWHASKSRSRWYARSRVRGHHTTLCVRMHRLIMGAQPGELIDHRNGDTLDNRRANLRRASASLNGANLFARRSNTGLKGVHRHLAGDVVRFTAQIQIRGRSRHLGTFDTTGEATRAYAVAAVEAFGEFANTDLSLDPVPSAAITRLDARPFAVALAARPDPLPAGRPPGCHDPGP